jgi:hypothetical protein
MGWAIGGAGHVNAFDSVIGRGSASQWPLAYAHAGMRILPVGADGTPLIKWGEGATAHRPTIESWFPRWPHCDIAWALPPTVVVVDIDRHHAGQDGFTDFLRLAGVAVDEVEAPRASTPRAGRHIFFDSGGRCFKGTYIPGTGIETKSAGRYVLLPLPTNGREWLRPLLDAELRLVQLPRAPAWLDIALKREETRSPAAVAPSPPTDDQWVRRQGLAALKRACDRIVAAECGEQDTTRHRECFIIGGLVARGDVNEAEAYDALLTAARAMPAYGRPWVRLEQRVRDSLTAGMKRLLELSAADRVMRNFRARMRAQRPRRG